MKKFFTNNKRSLVFFLAASLLSAPAIAQQAFYTNAIFGTDPGLTSPFTSGEVSNPNVTVSGIGRGSGIVGAPGDDRYNAANFTTSLTIDPTDYFEITITPKSNFLIDYTGFDFTLQSNFFGPTSIALRSSVDNFTSNIGTPFTDVSPGQVNSISLSGAQFQDVSTPITFRIYGYSSIANGGQLSVNDFTFYGVVFSQPLSSKLLAFDARKDASNVQLAWKTSCNSTTNTFTVEKSNGNSFTAIGNVSASAKGCNEGQDYNFATPAEAGRTLYRLAMRDASGQIEYSRTVAILNSDATASGDITVYPSIVNATLNVQGTKGGEACRIMDLSGRTLQSWNSIGGAETVSVSALPAGSYILVAEGNGARSTQRFVKQ